MKTSVVGVAWLLAGLVVLAVGCNPEGERCRKCGMLVDLAPRWIAGVTDETGAQERFCCERCMFSHLRSPEGAGARDAWVTEYYTQAQMPIAEVLFVVGSDVTGPMGKALVPVAGRAEAEQFMKDHYGRGILRADQITLEVLRELGGRALRPSE